MFAPLKSALKTVGFFSAAGTAYGGVMLKIWEEQKKQLEKEHPGYEAILGCQPAPNSGVIFAARLHKSAAEKTAESIRP